MRPACRGRGAAPTTAPCCPARAAPLTGPHAAHAQTTIFGVFCRRIGVPLIDGGTARLPRLIGLSRAMDLILTGRPVGADEAQQMGLANRVVVAGGSRAAAEELARTIAAFPQACLRADRQSAIEGADVPLAEAIRNEFVRGRETLAEAVHGARLFADGRLGRHGRA